MKSLYIAAIALSVFGSTYAEEIKLVSDGTNFSNICISAVTSYEDARVEAERLGMSKSDWQDLQCNGMNLKNFIRQYTPKEGKPLQYTIIPGNEQPATELCVAAIQAPQTLDALARMHFGSFFNVESSLECNGHPLEVFMKRFPEHGLVTIE